MLHVETVQILLFDTCSTIAFTKPVEVIIHFHDDENMKPAYKMTQFSLLR